MILAFYLMTSIITLFIMTLQTFLCQNGYIALDPFEAIKTLNDILDNEKDEKMKQRYENIINSMMENKLKFQLAISFCPIFNIFYSFKTIQFIIEHINKCK